MHPHLRGLLLCQGREVGGKVGDSRCGGGGVLVPVVPPRTGSCHSSHGDLVRGPTHAGHLLNECVPGRAGGGPRGAGGGSQARQARGLPVKLTWGVLQLRVVPASKQTHTCRHTVNEGPTTAGQRPVRPQDRGCRRSPGQPCLLPRLEGEDCAVTGQTDARTAVTPPGPSVLLRARPHTGGGQVDTTSQAPGPAGPGACTAPSLLPPGK